MSDEEREKWTRDELDSFMSDNGFTDANKWLVAQQLRVYGQSTIRVDGLYLTARARGTRHVDVLLYE